MPHRLLALMGCDLLIWARERAGLTRREAAMRAAVCSERLDEWEHDIGRPSLAELKRLADLYDVSVGTFFLKEPPMAGWPQLRSLPHADPESSSASIAN